MSRTIRDGVSIHSGLVNLQAPHRPVSSEGCIETSLVTSSKRCTGSAAFHRGFEDC